MQQPLVFHYWTQDFPRGAEDGEAVVISSERLTCGAVCPHRVLLPKRLDIPLDIHSLEVSESAHASQEQGPTTVFVSPNEARSFPRSASV